MKLGFIGTGKITSAVVTGICNSKIKYSKIIVSERNKKISKQLKKSFKKIYIAKNNQDIVNDCNWIFLAVTPTVANQIIHKLKFKKSQVIVSFISTMNLQNLTRQLK